MIRMSDVMRTAGLATVALSAYADIAGDNLMVVAYSDMVVPAKIQWPIECRLPVTTGLMTKSP